MKLGTNETRVSDLILYKNYIAQSITQDLWKKKPVAQS